MNVGKNYCIIYAGRPVMFKKFIWILKDLLKAPSYKNVKYFIRSNSSTFMKYDTKLWKQLEKIVINT